MSTTIIQCSQDDLQKIVAAEVKKGVAEALSQIIQPTKAGNGDNSGGEYLTRAEVCNLLHISKVTFHDWANKGLLQTFKAGSRTLVKAAELRQKVESGEIKRYKHSKYDA